MTSWNVCGARTYATATLGTDVSIAELARRVPAQVDSPPLLILRIAPDAARALPALERALGGAGRPAGVRDVCRVDDAIVVECDARLTALATLVALVDVELTAAPGRTIEPLIGIDDENLVAFARAILSEPDLTPVRLIEPHLADAIAMAIAAR